MMVTGVETAGLVLAAFPVLVAGLNSYVDGVRTIKRWKRFSEILDEYAVQISSHQTWFRQTIEQLLDKANIVESEELEAMMGDPGGKLWQKPEYDEVLRVFLGHSHMSYMQTIRALDKTLANMCHRLGFDPRDPGTVSWCCNSLQVQELTELSNRSSTAMNPPFNVHSRGFLSP